jgi:ubiquinol-cytochrome c reductase cytochrome b subunit
MILGIWKWLNERWPFSTVIKAALEEDIPGGSRYAYTLGSALLTIVLLQVTTGIFQVLYYVPTVDHAYNSLSYLRTKVPFGWLIHGLHYWGANAMIVVILLHLTRVFIWGAYKRPRELTWLFGVTLLLITFGLSFTGGPLPWDQAGYWAAEVGTSIPGSIPVVGDLTTNLMRGGPDMGQLTISRFFTLHAAVLPLALVLLIALHIVAFRTKGAVGPWDLQKRETTGPFWPDQAFKDTMTASAVVITLITLSVFLPPAYTGAADPLSTTFTPKPEWNFLFLYQALKYFKGPLEPLGVVGVPTLLVLILVAFPFLDRNPERNPTRRPYALAGAALLASVLVFLTIAGYVSQPGSAEQAISAGSAEAPAGGSHALKSAPATVESIQRGSETYRSNGCAGCHMINGSGGAIGPDLSGEGNRSRSHEWLSIQVRNPKTHYPDTVMPSFSRLGAQEISDLIDYLMSLTTAAAHPASAAGPLHAKAAAEVITPTETPGILTASKDLPGPAADIIGNPDQGELLFEKQCTSCHGPSGKGKIPNAGSDDAFVPALNPADRTLFNRNPKDFADAIDKYIQHGSTPQGQKPRLQMPAFGDNNVLTQQQISNIEAYILTLNGVDRAEPVNPGMSPLNFFFTAVSAFLLIMLLTGGIYICLPRNDRDGQGKSNE